MYTFDSQYETYLSEFNAYAEAYCKTLRTKPEVLGESMKYSLLLGGKRIRPLCLRWRTFWEPLRKRCFRTRWRWK